jgi:cytochrome c oxidase assembly protein subunit 15
VKPAYRLLLAAALILALSVVSLGAYVRLSDAGLGCPDWPGCYGKLVVPSAAPELAAAQSAFPQSPVEAPKAWKEMIHRYAAASLGVAIAALAVMAWRAKKARLTATALLLVVLIQAALGMLTVTQLLKPLIVTAHLAGGMTTLALLVLLWLRNRPPPRVALGSGLKIHALLALGVVSLQIALGGWTSSHYAAMICADFPTCQGHWWPYMDSRDAFALNATAPLGIAALTAIHWTHRLFAGAVAVVVGSFALRLIARPASNALGLAVLAALLLQIALGIANVVLHWPLLLAVAHNTGAALLLCTCVAAVGRVWTKERGFARRG